MLEDVGFCKFNWPRPCKLPMTAARGFSGMLCTKMKVTTSIMINAHDSVQPNYSTSEDDRTYITQNFALTIPVGSGLTVETLLIL